LNRLNKLNMLNKVNFQAPEHVNAKHESRLRFKGYTKEIKWDRSVSIIEDELSPGLDDQSRAFRGDLDRAFDQGLGIIYRNFG